MEDPQQNQDHSSHPSPRRFYAVGIEFAGTLILFLAGGYFLDRWLNTIPGFMFLCGLLGFYVAFRRLLKQADEARKSFPEEDRFDGH